jgi:hypothetical protein
MTSSNGREQTTVVRHDPYQRCYRRSARPVLVDDTVRARRLLHMTTVDCLAVIGLNLHLHHNQTGRTHLHSEWLETGVLVLKAPVLQLHPGGSPITCHCIM